MKLSDIKNHTQCPINDFACEMEHFGEVEVIRNPLDEVLLASGGFSSPSCGDLVVFLKSSTTPDRRFTGVVAHKTVTDQPLGWVFGGRNLQQVLRYIETGHHVRGRVLRVEEVGIEPEVPGGVLPDVLVLKAILVYKAQCPKQMVKSNPNEFVIPYLQNIMAYQAEEEAKKAALDAEGVKKEKAAD